MGKSDKENFNFKFQKEDRIPQQMNISSPTGFKDVCLPVGENMGKGIIHLCQNEEGLGYGEFTTRGVEDKLSYFVSYEKRCFKLPFLLTGREIQVGSEGIPGRIQVDSSISHFLSPDSVGIVDIERETPVHIVSFMIPESRLIYLLDELESGLPILVEKKILCTTENPYLHIGTVTPELKSVIDHIRLCHMHGNLRCLYLEGKLLELTALRLEQLHYDVPVLTSGAFPRLRKRDIERIREATDIIKSHLEEPLSISQLSRRVGINATKLKKGFRRELGNTVFGYIHHLRMEQAFRFLLDTEKNISEIAYDVGYANLSAFSAAFKKDFGISPSSVRKHELSEINRNS